MPDEEVIILSNTCLGHGVYLRLYNKEYNNPFIANLIPNDFDFIKLCNNIHHYITIEPVLGDPLSDTVFATQTSCKWWGKPPIIKTPYPVIFVGDIEIHFPHEGDNQLCLDTFRRRLTRMKEIIETKPYKIISLLSFSEFINDHEDTQSIIDLFLLNSNNIFVGPSLYKRNNTNYIIMDQWNNIKLERDDAHIYTFNNQRLLCDIFTHHIIVNYK